MTQPVARNDRLPQRLRHETRLRRLTVLATERLTPHMLRVTLGGEDLRGFASPGFGDHVKLFFPLPGQDASVLPVQGPDGILFPGPDRPAARDYTPRRHDAAANTLQIDFALHEAGPATAWAQQVALGQTLLMGGPRGSLMLPLAFDWHLLVGDDTALPAIARRLEELPPGHHAVVIAEVDGKEDEIAFRSAAEVTVRWVHRHPAPAGDAAALLAALEDTPFPPGEFQAWVACESGVARALRQALVERKGANPRWLRAAGYWQRGAAGVHETLNDAN
jgi:NADPH-dependent ferric siderophore reductase